MVEPCLTNFPGSLNSKKDLFCLENLVFFSLKRGSKKTEVSWMSSVDHGRKVLFYIICRIRYIKFYPDESIDYVRNYKI